MLALLVKNYIYFLVLKNNSIPKYVFLIFGFILFIFSIGVAVFTTDYEDKGILPLLLNIDLLLVLFYFMIRLLSKVLSLVAGRLDAKVVNPVEIFFGFEIKLANFYIVITVVQALLMLMYITL